MTQASEDEHRGVLADVGVEPREIWRVKYFASGGWDSAGLTGAFSDYAAGLHRRSYEYTLWLARFTSPVEATSAAPKNCRGRQTEAGGREVDEHAAPYAGGEPFDPR